MLQQVLDFFLVFDQFFFDCFHNFPSFQVANS